MITKEFQGKTKEEAVKLAVEELKLPESELEIEYLDEGKASFFGFRTTRPAKIRVYYNEMESEVCKKARNYLGGLFEAMGLEANVHTIDETPELINLRINSDVGGLLIGKYGKNLEALQFLTNVVCNKSSENWHTIILDTEGYRGKRSENLRRDTMRLVDTVRETGKPELMQPLNPAERRLVHLEIEQMDGLATESEGEGLYKRVRIFLKQP